MDLDTIRFISASWDEWHQNQWTYSLLGNFCCCERKPDMFTAAKIRRSKNFGNSWI